MSTSQPQAHTQIQQNQIGQHFASNPAHTQIQQNQIKPSHNAYTPQCSCQTQTQGMQSARITSHKQLREMVLRHAHTIHPVTD